MGRGSSNLKKAISPENKILVIEEDPKDVRRIREWLHQPGENRFAVETTDRLSSGLKRLSVERYSLVLLNLRLPDSSGLETFQKVHKQIPGTPIIIQSNLHDESEAVTTVQQGAQDYLIKSDLDGKLLTRSIRYAIERQRLLEEIRSLSLVDELTGLYNRRGFTALAEKQLKVAKRANERMHFLFIDLDALKGINDQWGHGQGDCALMEIARILKKTFRESDIVARVGGDEFCVLARESEQNHSEVLTRRLLEKIEEENRKCDRPYTLSVSLGVVHFDPENPCTPSDLISQADDLMYRQKRNKKNRSTPDTR